MRAGDLVASNVRLDHLLGTGGMGEVWVAAHLTLHSQVVVKFMNATGPRFEEAVTRFKREASAAAQIRSPHVVQVFDRGVTPDGAPYIVMELLHGEDLGARLARGPLGVAETLQVVRQVCKALGAAHQQGIVHRDIKPGNLFLVESDGELFVKVLDFGIAKRVDNGPPIDGVTRSGSMMGTPKYMSPEQVMRPGEVDLRSDLWSLGVVAYVCLTGTEPFVGETLGSLAVAIEAAVFVLPSQRSPSLPPSLDGWFARALARAPADRFASAREMADAMLEALPERMRSLRPAVAVPPQASPSPASLAGPTRLMFSGPPSASTGEPSTDRVGPPPMSASDAITRILVPGQRQASLSAEAPSLGGGDSIAAFVRQDRTARARLVLVLALVGAVCVGLTAWVLMAGRSPAPPPEQARPTAPSVVRPPPVVEVPPPVVSVASSSTPPAADPPRLAVSHATARPPPVVPVAPGRPRPSAVSPAPPPAELVAPKDRGF